jgi:hypothetical protein
MGNLTPCEQVTLDELISGEEVPWRLGRPRRERGWRWRVELRHMGDGRTLVAIAETEVLARNDVINLLPEGAALYAEEPIVE